MSRVMAATRKDKPDEPSSDRKDRTDERPSSAERRRATYRERLTSLEPRLAALRLRESPSRLLRQDRQRS